MAKSKQNRVISIEGLDQVLKNKWMNAIKKNGKLFVIKSLKSLDD